jgi:hypothetical protein
MASTLSRKSRVSSSLIENVDADAFPEHKCAFRANGVKESGISNGLSISPVQPVHDQDGYAGLRSQSLGMDNRHPNE